MRKIILLLLVSIQTASAAELPPPERAALIRRLSDLRGKVPGMQAHFVEEKTTHLLKKPLRSEGNIAFSVPNKFRREQTGSSPSLTVCNGKTLSIFYPNFNEVEIYTLGQRAFFDDSLAALTAGLNFENVDEFYNVHAFTDEPAYRIVLDPKKPNLKRIISQLTVWIDDALTPIRTDIVLPKGDRIVANYPNAKRTTVPNSLFEFTVPAGAHISHPLGK
jgi:outer membrane lipoprotein-sorting protein